MNSNINTHGFIYDSNSNVFYDGSLKTVFELRGTLARRGSTLQYSINWSNRIVWYLNWVQTNDLCYVVPSISFLIFLVQAFRIFVDAWNFSILYILWDDWQIFMFSGSNELLQQQLEYILLKPNCHSWEISKIQSGREYILEEIYAIKFCFWNRTTSALQPEETTSKGTRVSCVYYQ